MVILHEIDTMLSITNKPKWLLITATNDYGTFA